jgi:hypothetical protein
MYGRFDGLPSEYRGNHYCVGRLGGALVRHAKANEERWQAHFTNGQGVAIATMESPANNQPTKEKLCFARYHRGLSAQA